VVREELGFSNGPVILYAGRIHKRKGLQYLLPAFKEVLTEFPQATLVICGPDYGYRQELLKLVADTTMRENVVWTGEVEHGRMPQIYAASDIVVLPAEYEVFGHVLAEAASCGKAIVATKWGWVAEFFENGKECMLVDGYGNVRALADTLRILLRDATLRASMGTKAREKVLRNLSWESCALAHSRTYEKLLRGTLV
jgi:phosphatidylinositol alpha-mannosyltransferase